jgi:hypothetical protein
MGCGSFHSDCTFVFGSCRAFWNQRCLSGPPALPVPLGYDH